MFRMVTLYAVRGRLDGRDIVEDTDVIVKTKDGKEICGRLQDVGYDDITVYDPHNEKEHRIEYENIKNINEDN